MSYVFISHASPDKPRIKPIIVALRKAGLQVWLDNPVAAGFSASEVESFHRIRAGGRWEDEIDEAKKQAACILVCWSSHAVTDGVVSGKERITWLEEAGYARAEQKLLACTIDEVSPTALPGTHSAQQMPCLDPAMGAERWNAAMTTVIADIGAMIARYEGEREAAASISMYIEGLESFCGKSTYTLGDSLSSDAKQLYVDIDAGQTTIQAMSLRARGDKSSDSPPVALARELLADVIDKDGAAVLCGGAGTGKSTLIRRFALLAWSDPAAVGLSCQRLPFLVRLRHIAVASGETFEQKIRNAFISARDFTLLKPMPDDFLTSWPKAAKVSALLLFDGLDEVPSADRRRVLTFLEQLRKQFPAASMVITTRDADLLRNTIFASADACSCLTLYQLSPSQAADIARALLSEAELQRFFQERDRGRSFAFDTALGVRMAAAIIRRDRKLPDTRGELYELLIRQSFGDATEGPIEIPDVLVNDEGILRVLGSIAASQFDVSIHSAPIVSEAVADALQELRSDMPPPLARGAANEVLGWLRTRGGVMTSVEPVAWSHETCREFLAARWITQRFKPEDSVILDLTARACHEPRLRSVVLFAFSIWASSPPYRDDQQRCDLAETLSSFFCKSPEPTEKPSLLQRLFRMRSATERSPEPAISAAATLLLAEIFAELRPGSTQAVKSIIDRLSRLHSDFIGYFDEPRGRCAGDEGVVRCLRRWADHPPLMEALQPIADRYERLFRQFDLPKSGVVHFLLLAGRSSVVLDQFIEPGRLLPPADLADGLRGCVAAEGPHGPTALKLARRLLSGQHSPLEPLRARPGARFVFGSEAKFEKDHRWIAPEGRGAEADDRYNAALQAVTTLLDAGFEEEVAARLASDEVSEDFFSACIGGKKTRGLALRYAADPSLSVGKRAFAISVLLAAKIAPPLNTDEIIEVLGDAERDPAHTKWASRVKSAFCEENRLFDDMHASCTLLAAAEPANAGAWFDLGWCSLQRDVYEESLVALERAAAEGQDPRQVHYFRGLALYHLDRPAEATLAFDEAALAGNDELRMWEARLKAKHLASWYAAVAADVDVLYENESQDELFVRHWRAISYCIAGRYAEALQLFTVLRAEPYEPFQADFYHVIALIGAGDYEKAGTLIDSSERWSDQWKDVLRFTLAAARGDANASLVKSTDLHIAETSSNDELEAGFWLCAALDDVEGASRCVDLAAARGDARMLSTILADRSTIFSVLTKPWCGDVVERALKGLSYPAEPLSGAEIIALRTEVSKFKKVQLLSPEIKELLHLLEKSKVDQEQAMEALVRGGLDQTRQLLTTGTCDNATIGSLWRNLGQREFLRLIHCLAVVVTHSDASKRPITMSVRKTLFQQGMMCRLRSIETHEEEHSLAEELMAQHGKETPTVVMIRLGKTDHMFALCNFKFSSQDPFDLKYSGPLPLYISYGGGSPLREQILDPFKVQVMVCNDLEFIKAMKEGVRPALPLEYRYVDRLPEFFGREVQYG
ncbi:hypothetical protein CVM73_20710 [Bradyrhizobium forestalis]|uniref:NACHT domain-containing protein n=1 Tax=Bradyrhizobium forestalis TaxID=1419263 RepID=A0A2M8R679_9BRAD|nr:TIR domain-containing protein [Bradyrhizobium forestalis]PJG53331.1 hypothetical protein CVM73_20710 [Bradyrhizobium forestalis]